VPLSFTLKNSGSFGFSVRTISIVNPSFLTGPFRSGPHYIGIYYDGSTTYRPQNVVITITGSYCDNKTGAMCDGEIKPLVINDNITTNMNHYYSYEVTAPALNSILQNLLINFYHNDTITTYARYHGVPAPDLYDVMGGQSLSFVDPAIGTWIILVVVNTTNHTNYIPSSISTYCQNGTTGINCTVPIKNTASFTNGGNAVKYAQGEKLAKNNDIQYYALYNYTYNQLYVSLYDASKDNKAMIYASFNRPPQMKNMTFDADIYGCNGQFCTSVQSISTKSGNLSLKDGTYGTWYVAVVAQRDTTEYIFWYDTVCPNDCGSQGSCPTTGDNYGLCQCNTSYTAPLCTQSSQVVEYIILIVIAALVLVSAILGLIAWAYMRRRAQYVEVK